MRRSGRRGGPGRERQGGRAGGSRFLPSCGGAGAADGVSALGHHPVHGPAVAAATAGESGDVSATASVRVEGEDSPGRAASGEAPGAEKVGCDTEGSVAAVARAWWLTRERGRVSGLEEPDRVIPVGLQLGDEEGQGGGLWDRKLGPDCPVGRKLHPSTEVLETEERFGAGHRFTTFRAGAEERGRDASSASPASVHAGFEVTPAVTLGKGASPGASPSRAAS